MNQHVKKSSQSSPVLVKNSVSQSSTPLHSHPSFHHHSNTSHHTSHSPASHQKKDYLSFIHAEKIWHITLVTALVFCLVLISFLGYRSILLQQQINTLNQGTNQQNMPNEVQQSRQSVVSLQQKRTASEMQNFKQNLLKRTTNEIDKQILSNTESSDWFEPIGAAVLIDTNLFLTAKHLVANGGNFQIQTIGGKTASVEVVALHPFDDLALLNISESENILNIKPVSLANERSLGQQMWSTNIGYSLLNSVSSGVISATNQNFSAELDTFFIESQVPKPLQQGLNKESNTNQTESIFTNSIFGESDLFLHSALASPESAGSPIFNELGQLLGINAFSLQQSNNLVYVLKDAIDPNSSLQQNQQLSDVALEGISPSPNQHFNIAVGSTVINSFISAYKERKQLPLFDAEVRTLTPAIASLISAPSKYGLIVTNTKPDGSFNKNGIQKASIITSVNNIKITEYQNLGSILQYLQPGQSVDITYFTKENTNWNEKKATITLAGITIQPAN